jgi:murein L,D-transpeptidase YcbB/YkuD
MDIDVLQTVLKYFGYYSGEITGEWDLELELALRSFQKEAGLLSLGVIDKYTLVKLQKLEEQMK